MSVLTFAIIKQGVMSNYDNKYKRFVIKLTKEKVAKIGEGDSKAGEKKVYDTLNKTAKKIK